MFGGVETYDLVDPSVLADMITADYRMDRLMNSGQIKGRAEEAVIISYVGFVVVCRSGRWF